jgi:outer membrane receptor protein involved in Fe transport
VTTGIELRYSSDEVEVGTVPNPGAAGQPQLFSETFYNLSPRLTVSWQATENLMPYANIARGNSPGTFNPTVPALASGSPDESYRDVGEEVIWNYELGLRGESPDRRAAFALAAYFLDVNDQQFTTVVELPDGRTTSLLDNVGHSRVIGFELETSAELTDELTGRLTYSWTDSEIRSQTSEEYADLRGSNGSFEEAEQLGDLEGKDTPRVPEHMASLMLEYRRPWRPGIDWFAGGDYSFETSRFAQDDNLIESGDRHLLGLHTGIAWNQAQLRLWVANLTDDDTPVDIQRYIDSRYGRLPTCQSFVTAGTAPPGTQCAGSSTTPRGFAISLPHGRQAGATLSYRF